MRTLAAVDRAIGDILRAGETLRVANIVDRANVGRSTFYDHFDGVEDALLRALKKPLGQFADCVTGLGSVEALSDLLEHFWENRQLGRKLLFQATGRHVSRLLAELVKARLGATSNDRSVRVGAAAIYLSEGSLGLLRGWVTAEFSAHPTELALAIVDLTRSVDSRCPGTF